MVYNEEVKYCPFCGSVELTPLSSSAFLCNNCKTTFGVYSPVTVCLVCGSPTVYKGESI